MTEFDKTYQNLIRLFKENVQIDLDRAYELFSAEYLQTTGQTWSKEKFMSRARNWTFFGDENGYVAVRNQNSGFVKLVGTAGNNKSKYKGFQELMKSGQPVWGMVSADIKPLLLKLGFRTPNMIERPILKQLLSSNVLGDAQLQGYTNDGGVTLSYPDVGTVTKYFLGSPAYWKKLYSSPMMALKKKFLGQ